MDVVKRALAEHPDVFESRTGDAAKAVGRSALATVWQLRTEPEIPEAAWDEFDAWADEHAEDESERAP